MQRLFFLLLLLLSLPGTVLAKCPSPLLWKRWINEKTLPPGVEIFDRVWIRNPTATELILYTTEKNVAKTTGYRATLGEVPTTDHELPQTRLLNDERYEFHPPLGGGWIRQEYAAALIEPKLPVVPPAHEKRLLSEKLTALEIKAPVSLYFGKKKTAIEFIFEFRKNPAFGVTTPDCPAP